MTGTRRSDDELFADIRRELFTAVVGEVMDRLGLRRQFLSPRVRPLRDDMVVVGRAMTVLEADVFEEPPQATRKPLMSRPFGLMLKALDDLRRGEVYICTGSSAPYALWGELMSTRAVQLGAAGAVVDGFSRDTRGILALDPAFAVFSHGPYAQDQGPRGKVIDFRCPIETHGVRIESGDVVFGDLDGVCVVSRRAETDVFRLAPEKARGETRVARAIRSGMSAVEAFDSFGIM